MSGFPRWAQDLSLALLSLGGIIQASASEHRIASQSVKVGLISFDLKEGRSAGTAFLVSPCEIMTSFHVVFGPWYVTALRPPSRLERGLFVLSGVTYADGSHPVTMATPVAWGNYLGPDRQFRRPGEDWALLTLDHCLGRAYGHLTLADPASLKEVFEPESLAAIGYSTGRQMTDLHCSIVRGPGNSMEQVMFHDCVTMHGDSGAPIFYRYSNKAIAITSGYRSGAGESECAAEGFAGQDSRRSACANTAVLMSASITGKIAGYVAAVGAQRELLRLGYKAGSLGDTDSKALTLAISAAEADLGLAVTGRPSHALQKLLMLRTQR